ncbi:P-loop containing nucleoside triphosphate hydrolase protein [Halteromyces radiatus]|uniref:P-loop containing nucleoside triphosphate hydrolase protein n=1 Tax=Halteromyces radiatus TaxID=101107 RepID=UPI00221F95BE|nr:P-loop containing nucleoside triphosphate hydrolase protein [Halteromyces radiatus]KAI8084697.1 P-loop containing nucleoside triphosphate hydrolase protein [Halteromyces radiatus]
MDPQLGTAIGLSEGQKVNVEFCRNVPECTTVNVEPHTEDDWEILELHAGYVEENLLSQIRVVYTNQLMCVWIHGKTLVRLRVAELNPRNEFVKLTTNTEVIVAPKVRQLTKASDLAASAQFSSAKDQKMSTPHICLRNLSDTPDIVTTPMSVMIHPDDLSGVSQGLVRLSKVIPVSTTDNDEDKENTMIDDDLSSPAKFVYAFLEISTTIPRYHVSLGSVIKSTLDLDDFDIVRLAAVTVRKSTPGSLVFRRFVTSQASNSTLKFDLDSNQNQAQEKSQKEKILSQELKKVLSSMAVQDSIALTQGLVVSLSEGKGLIQFGQKKRLFGVLGNGSSPSDHSTELYTTLSSTQVKDLQIDIGEDITKMEDTNKTKKAPLRSSEMGGIEKIFKRLYHYTMANITKGDLKNALGVPGSGGVLVTGAHGSGKTELIRKLLYTARTDRSSLTYTLEVNCAEIADERIPNLKEMLQKWCDEAAWHAPSILFFDDIDRLIPAEVEHADSTRSRHIAELFTQVILTMTKRHSIMVIATSQQQSIHPSLITNHVFSELRHLNPPSRDERKQIMHSIMAQGSSVLTKSLPNIDLVSVASETEGYLAADLKALIERAVHEGAVRSIKEKMGDNRLEQVVDTDDQQVQQSLQLIQQDFTQAREGFVPSSLRGVKLQSSGVNWSDIGGLNETRHALLETLEWPTKYASVFAQCPLRLRSGVKGPEILNKYIGASEKSVRDLFERASAAKPCVLFFDEFDSIAPRRGHDSTGVTDRVVNQMLTQMDGAEGLDGVYVLAATSRPDLIDPALLRPGRLDKALLCGMPNFDERLEILQALSRKMTLASEVDLKEYAKKTEGFSGADLQGFLYNAHLEAIHGTINIDSFKEQQKKEKEVTENNEEINGDFVMIGGHDGDSGKTKTPLTLAEKGQISQRLTMIKKGIKGNNNKKNNVKKAKVVEQEVAMITVGYLEKSLKSTRPSITAEEYMRLKSIYDEFVTGRTGELPSGEGAKGIGKRSTLG